MPKTFLNDLLESYILKCIKTLILFQLEYYNTMRSLNRRVNKLPLVYVAFPNIFKVKLLV